MLSTIENILVKKKILINTLIALGVSVFPLIPLFIYKFFYVDWLNNLWVIQYYARFFENNIEMPVVINTSNGLIGMTNPLYYGYLYYQILGLIALLIGGARRAVIAVLVILSIAFYIIYLELFKKVFRTCDKSDEESLIFSICYILPAIMLWSTYLLTKIYSDGARAEVNAIMLLYILIGLWIHGLLVVDGPKRLILLSCFSFLLFIFIGTHPITTEIGGVLLFILVIGTLPYVLRSSKNPLKMLVYGLILLMLVLLAVSPWIYITVLNAGTTNLGGAGVLGVNNKSWIGNIANRLMPVPFDCEAVKDGIYVMSPYMTLQINVPLFIIFIMTFVLVVCNKRITKKSKIGTILVTLIVAFFFACCSLESLGDFVKTIFYSVQLNFRLITYTDLFIAAGLVYDVYLLIKAGEILKFKNLIWSFMVIGITLSSHNIITQWTYAYALSDYYMGEVNSSQAPTNFYWLNDYADISVPVVSKDELGFPMTDVYFELDKSGVNVEDTYFENDSECIVSTNVSISPYNTLLLDGNPVAYEDIIRMNDSDYTCSFVVRRSGNHTLSYKTILPDAYFVLKKIAFISAIILLLLVIANILRLVYMAAGSDKLEDWKCL